MPKICSRYAQDMTTRKTILTKRLPDKTSKPVCLKKMSHKSVLTKCLPDKTSKLVLTKRLPDKTSKAVLTKCLPDKASADPYDMPSVKKQPRKQRGTNIILEGITRLKIYHGQVGFFQRVLESKPTHKRFNERKHCCGRLYHVMGYNQIH